MNDVLQPLRSMRDLLKEIPDISNSWLRYYIALMRAVDRERAEFTDSALIAAQLAIQAAKENPMSLMETLEVVEHTRELATRGIFAHRSKVTDFAFDQVEEVTSALFNTILGTKGKGEDIAGYLEREAQVMEAVANFHEQIEKIKDEFGFQFASTNYKLIHETGAFKLYQVLPTKEGVKVRDDLKPVVLVPPYMLGSHILAFLPGENKSYAHSYANEGIPTYVRVTKDIMHTEAVQDMTPEEDCLQTVELCNKVMEEHGQGRKVTLNGTCQGGYICLMNVLTGKYKDVCDALITNVTPIDGTYSPAISGMPAMHHDFVTTTLHNGKNVSNGYLLSLGMRFVAIDREAPLIKVLDQASLHKSTDLSPPKTVAALFRWLLKERVHLPLEIAKMSSHTFREPIAENGDLPVQLFDKPLNIGDLDKLNIKWHQNYAVKDDLVTPACATAGNKFLEGTDVLESVPFPGGHVAILTSPYSKRSPVNGEFEDKEGNKHRGPVKFQLDITV